MQALSCKKHNHLFAYRKRFCIGYSYRAFKIYIFLLKGELRAASRPFQANADSRQV